jgi:putative ABC transport system substrate-binding protein
MRQETRSIPIVFVLVTDPVGQGFVASLVHAGGNITGLLNYDPAIGSKWLELLKEIAPGLAPRSFLIRRQLLTALPAVDRSFGSKFAVTTTAAPVHDAPKSNVPYPRPPALGFIITISTSIMVIG